MTPDQLAREIADLKQRLHNMQRPATVIKVDHANQRLKVSDGGWTSRWMRWITARAHEEASWSPPAIGERVMVLAPGGNLDQSYALPAINCADNAPPDSSEDRSVRRFADGTLLRQDSGAMVTLLQLPDSGELRIQIGNTTISAKSSGIEIMTPAMTANEQPMATVGDSVPITKGSSKGTYKISTGVGS